MAVALLVIAALSRDWPNENSTHVCPLDSVGQPDCVCPMLMPAVCAGRIGVPVATMATVWPGCSEAEPGAGISGRMLAMLLTVMKLPWVSAICTAQPPPAV